MGPRREQLSLGRMQGLREAGRGRPGLKTPPEALRRALPAPSPPAGVTAVPVPGSPASPPPLGLRGGTSHPSIRALHDSTDAIVTEQSDVCLIPAKIAAMEPYFARSTN